MPLPVDPNSLSWTQVMEHVGACVYVKDIQGRHVYANRAMCELYGVTWEQLRGKTDADFVNAPHALLLQEADRSVIESGKTVHEQEEVVLLGGGRRTFWSAKVPLLDGKGRIIGVCGFSTEIAPETTPARERIAGHSHMLGALLENVDASIFLKDSEGRYLYVNEKARKLHGRTLEQVLGTTDKDLFDAETARTLRLLDEQVITRMQRHAGEETLFGADGCWHHFWTVRVPMQYPGMPPCLLGFATEITELLDLRRNLREQRVTDRLTGLPNHEQFVHALTLQIPDLLARHQHAAVVLLDLDEFKYVNGYLGQEAGNRLLCEVAERLRGALPEPGVLGRIGGDDFAVALAPVADRDEAVQKVQLLRECLAQPYTIRGRGVRLTTSAGIAMLPSDGEDAQTLLEHAEAAMYAAKQQGRDCKVFYTTGFAAAAAQRVNLENALRTALAANQFEVHYQPKMLRDGTVAGFEALLRWNRPGHGRVSPLTFIPLAERLGLLVDIGAWVTRQACETMATWREAGLGRVPVAVNLSISQLQSSTLLPRVQASMQEYDIGANELGMEVTESMMMRDPDQTIDVLRSLVQAGVDLAIDDFGTGYSSMAYLKLLPVRWLKLDRQFVKDMHTDARDADLCAGMIALAHRLGLRVIAEGVELAEQRDALLALGCDQFQGFLYSTPMPRQAATQYLRSAQAR
ncbi:MAG: EAL domain-containing protein [Comamonas sp.]